MSTEDQVVDPATQDPVTPTAEEQVQQPANTDQPTGDGQDPQTNVDSAPQQPDKPKNDWVQRRIDQLTRERYEEKRQREALEAERDQLRDQLRGQQQPETTPNPGATDPAVVQQQIEQRAAQLVQDREFVATCNKVFEAGKTEFPDFESSLKTFGMLGGANRPFLEAVTSLDSAHKVLHHLGQNPETAEKLLTLPPTQMALQLARLEMTLAEAPPVSKAPTPIAPIGGGKSTPVEPEEFSSAEEQIAYWKKQKRK